MDNRATPKQSNAQLSLLVVRMARPIYDSWPHGCWLLALGLGFCLRLSLALQLLILSLKDLKITLHPSQVTIKARDLRILHVQLNPQLLASPVVGIRIILELLILLLSLLTSCSRVGG